MKSLLHRLWRVLQILIPFGLLVPNKPRHYREMFRVLWENRGRWRYAWRILAHGVCDGCSLGPRGLKDDVIPGVHLCLTRLGLLRLNTMARIPDDMLGDVERLRALSNEELHRLGRVPAPLVRRPGDKGFRKITWAEAAELVAGAMKKTDPDRMAFFVSSRGLTNEAYYTVQKLARIAGTPHVDSCARLCHAASSAGLKATIGWAAPTCSLKDIIGTDLLVLIGTDLVNNQPVSAKYMHMAKLAGTQIALVNPFREPSLDRYWVPSVPISAAFGTKLTDHHFPVRAGGDIAFLYGVLKYLDEESKLDDKFVLEQTSGIEALRAKIESLSWDDLEKESGLSRDRIVQFAKLYARAKTAVILYSMGLTQYAFGVDNVKMVVNLALARGNLGREKTGIIPIRGHSGVQGTAECGADADKLPGGVDIDDANCERFEKAWGHPIPRRHGLRAAHALDRAADGGMDLMYLVGGNFLETMPDPANARRGLERVKVRVHQDIVLNTSALVDCEEMVVVLPAQTRYESGGTSTSTERRIRLTPAIEDPDGVQIPGARAEWEIPCILGKALRPELPRLFAYESASDVRAEMAKLMPLYRGIDGLEHEGDSVQWGGERLGTAGFTNMPEERALFSAVEVPRTTVPEGKFVLTTRRGKQFNSMTYGQKDPITGARERNDVILAPEDLDDLGLAEGDLVVLRSEFGSMRSRARGGPCRRRHVQAFWPEANVLIGRKYDPVSGEPDYNAVVSIERAP